MIGEQPRAPRWMAEAGSAVRRAGLPGLTAAVRREKSSVLHLRRSEEPTAGLGRTDARPGSRLPEGFALLRVQRSQTRDSRDGYRLHGWCGSLKVSCAPGPTRLIAPAVSLGTLRRGDGEFPSEVLRAVLHWSDNQRALAHWINQARRRHGARLRLIVWDDTGYELPWELFRLPDDPELGLGGGLLGALVAVARWTTVHDTGYDLPRETGAFHGGVLAYLHRDMERDHIALKPYAPRPHKEITPFLRALEASTDRTGLVYMGCHGEYGHTVTRLQLAGRTWAEFNGEQMHLLRRDHSLVCLNACHSGRFVDNRAQGEEALRGFAELFLRKGAGGCIVTAGAIGDPEARAMVHRLVREVTARSQQPLTEKLRAFRADAVREFGGLAAIPNVRNDDGEVDAVGQKRVLRLLYAFMFHYYGHPLTTLRLVDHDEGRSS
ncbi:CHAT domain-containing protein [Streptomyces sp. NPDC101234]|uniref:CHAT domain-containing protein n=1 Tax=Streptomyces sp. NPDC101234 TaxID=3366138 RepID=UPI00381A8B30